MKAYFNELVKVDDPFQQPHSDILNASVRRARSESDLESVMSFYYSEALAVVRPRVVQLLQTEEDMAKVQELSVQAVMLSLPEIKLLAELVTSRQEQFTLYGLSNLVQLAENLHKYLDSYIFIRTPKEVKYVIFLKEKIPEEPEVVQSDSLHRSYSILPKTDEFKQRKVLSRVKEAVRNLLFGLDSFSLFFESKEDSSLDEIVAFVLRFSYLFESRKSSHEKVALRVLAQYLQTHLEQIPEEFRVFNYRKLYYELVSEYTRRTSSQTAQLLLICKSQPAINSVEKHLVSIKQEIKLLQSSQRDRRFLIFVEEAEVASCVFHEDTGHVFVSHQKECPHTKFESNLALGPHRFRRSSSSLMTHFHLRKSLKSMSDVHIPGHTQTIEEFVHDFSNIESVRFSLLQEKDLSSVGEAFFAYMNLVREAIASNDLYRGKSKEEWDEVLEQVEAFITRKMYSLVFPRESTETDVRFYRLTQKLEWVQPQHLNIALGQFIEEMSISAVRALKEMDECRSPAEKLTCLMDCVNVIVNILELSGTPEAGAGDTTPIVIYVLLKAQPARIHSNLNYIQRFRNREKMMEGGGFCFTAILSGIEFIETITAKNLNLTEEEFQLRMGT